MKLNKVKTQAEALAAMRAATPGRDRLDFTMVDGSFTAMRVGQLHVVNQNYGMQLLRESEGNESTRYKLTATTKGFPPVVSYHDTYADRREAAKAFGDSADLVEADDVPVIIGEDGQVVRENHPDLTPVEQAARARKDELDDVPF